jgi:hypothetical protein
MRVNASIVFALMMSTSIASGHAASEIAPLRVGDALPRLEGTFLTGRAAVLPAASSGKVTFIMVGFTYASRFPVETWGEWFRKTAGTRGDVTFFEVPMIGGLARLGRWFIDSGMRKGTPAALHDNVITVYSKAGDWKKRLGVSPANEDDAFLILADEAGVVRWLYHGKFDEAPAEDLKRLLASHRTEP